MTSQTDLAALLCSRLCHDMLSPVGALSNGLELLTDEHDPEMRERLASLNPTASARMADRLIEAEERQYWKPNAADREALREAGADLEDRLEGITHKEVVAA